MIIQIIKRRINTAERVGAKAQVDQLAQLAELSQLNQLSLLSQVNHQLIQLRQLRQLSLPIIQWTSETLLSMDQQIDIIQLT